jgi:hypothetical protein
MDERPARRLNECVLPYSAEVTVDECRTGESSAIDHHERRSAIALRSLGHSQGRHAAGDAARDRRARRRTSSPFVRRSATARRIFHWRYLTKALDSPRYTAPDITERNMRDGRIGLTNRQRIPRLGLDLEACRAERLKAYVACFALWAWLDRRYCRINCKILHRDKFRFVIVIWNRGTRVQHDCASEGLLMATIDPMRKRVQSPFNGAVSA